MGRDLSGEVEKALKSTNPYIVRKVHTCTHTHIHTYMHVLVLHIQCNVMKMEAGTMVFEQKHWGSLLSEIIMNDLVAHSLSSFRLITVPVLCR